MAPEARQRVEGGLVDRRHHPPDPTRGAEQRRGLALDRGRVVLLRAGHVEEVLQLEDLASAQLPDRRREQRRHRRAERRGQRRRPRQEIVAGEDGDDVGPPRVHRRDPAARLGLVDHVVVVQRPEMDQLDRHRAGHGVLRRGTIRPHRRVRRAEGQGGTNPLPPRLHQVRRDVTQEPVGVPHRGGQRVLHPPEVSGQRPELEGLRQAHKPTLGRGGRSHQAREHFPPPSAYLPHAPLEISRETPAAAAISAAVVGSPTGRLNCTEALRP